jgi:hypothetical protein
MNTKGLGQIPFLILITVFIGAVLIGNDKQSFLSIPVSINSPTISPSQPTSESSVVPTLLPSPTLTATIIPTVKPTPSTPKPVSGPPGAGYSSITVATEKGNFSAKVMSINLGSSKVITDTANDSDCSDNCATLTLQDFVTRNGGYAGVNGTYFCPDTYSDCSAKKNSFDFPVYNTRLSKWINGGNLFWNGRAIIYFDGGGAHYLQNASGFGGGLTAGIVNYPGLVDGGNVQIDDNQSGLSDKQRAVGTKVGIGLISTDKVIVVVGYNVNMQQFAYVFKSLGATGALNLDTGGSTALYYNGYKLGPGRNIPNAIIFANK